MLELNAYSIPIDSHRLVAWALPCHLDTVITGQGDSCKAVSHGFFVAGMDITAFACIDDNGLPGIG